MSNPIKEIVGKNNRMRIKVQQNSLLNTFNTFFLIMLLVGLNISTPSVFAGQLIKKACGSKQLPLPVSSSEEDGSKSTSEEKGPESKKFSEDYLHDSFKYRLISSHYISCFYGRGIDIYIAFHQELLVPPPNFS